MPFTGAISKVNHGTLHERIYDELKQAIIAGHLESGEVVTIRPLAQELGTSVMPVRDALLRLAAERALELLPNRSIRVPLMTRTGFDELYHIRTNLEGMATAMAAESITDEEIGALEHAADLVAVAIEAGDGAEWQAARKDFFFTIYGAARSLHLMPMIESMWLQCGPIQTAPFRQFMEEGGDAVGNWGRLGELIDALRAHDPDVARATIEQAFTEAVTWYHDNYSFDAADETGEAGAAS
jgi:DNA-binding GntR family transcriptional regulator